MTIHEVFNRLRPVSQAAASLLRDTGFHPDDGLGDGVCPLPDAYEDAFLRDKAEEILEALDGICTQLRYLGRPSHGEYTLEKLPNDRYGYRDKDGCLHEFTCGDSLEAKLCDKYGRRRWVASHIEFDGFDYFLMGFHSVPLAGLTVRERW